MKKYGDLNSTEFDMDFFESIKDRIIKGSEFEVAWKALGYEESKNSVLLEEESLISISLKARPTPYNNTLYNELCNDDSFFEKCFIAYLEEMGLYEADLKTALIYNSCVHKRKNKPKNKITSCNDTYDKIKKVTRKEYILPFTYSSNNYEDFCAYTLNSLYKNPASLACFKKTSFKKDYTEAFTFDRILSSLSCRKGENYKVSNNDRWLIEKIFGLNTILELMSVIDLFGYKENFENVFIPVLNTLITCKPINIRLSLANMTAELLFKISALRIDSYNNSDIDFNIDIINRLIAELKNSIIHINSIYVTLLKTFYEMKIIPRQQFGTPIILADNSETIFLNFSDKNEFYPENKSKKSLFDVLNDILFLNSEKYIIAEKILYNKGNCKSNTLSLQYAILQSQSIQNIHKNFN